VAQHFGSVDDYISTFPSDVQTVLQAARKTIHAAAPGAKESITYQIPTFSISGRPGVYLAGWKKHIGRERRESRAAARRRSEQRRSFLCERRRRRRIHCAMREQPRHWPLPDAGARRETRAAGCALPVRPEHRQVRFGQAHPTRVDHRPRAATGCAAGLESYFRKPESGG
jgi:hypothetical protein